MGSDPRAHLAYGYDLGTGEDWKLAEQTGYAELLLDWFDQGDDEDEDHEPAEFTTQAYNRLFTAIPESPEVEDDYDREKAVKAHFGVEFEFSGADDGTGFMLIAVESERSVEWSDAMTLDLTELHKRPVLMDWDRRLARAVEVLGFTPTQDGPKWLVFPSYG